MFVDTHCHLNMMVKQEIDSPLHENHFLMIDQILKEAVSCRVEKFITIGTSLIESKNSIEIANKFESVFAAVGIHPCDCTQEWKKDFEEIRKLIYEKNKNKIIGIGETGLDFFHKPFFKERQIEAFLFQIELAIEQDLALIVHVRQSANEVLEILEKYKNKNLRGVIHCFSQRKEFAEKILKLGFYVGINGPITYPKNNELREIIKDIPLDRILLETDAPFLPPEQFRGKQNRPSYIPLFANVIADLKKIDIYELEKITTDNAKNLFKF